MATKSIQETFAPNNKCFGCGPANPDGLRIRSFVEGDEVVCTWHPKKMHEAFDNMLNGGIVGSLLDCHCNWTAAHYLMAQRDAEIPPCTVTAKYEVKLRRPTPTDGPVHLRARVIESTDNSCVVEATLEAGDAITARFSGTFVAIEEGHPAFHRW